MNDSWGETLLFRNDFLSKHWTLFLRNSTQEQSIDREIIMAYVNLHHVIENLLRWASYLLFSESNMDKY